MGGSPLFDAPDLPADGSKRQLAVAVEAHEEVLDIEAGCPRIERGAHGIDLGRADARRLNHGFVVEVSSGVPSPITSP